MDLQSTHNCLLYETSPRSMDRVHFSTNITLCWGFSERVFMISCKSSISKTSMQPLSLMQSPNKQWCLRHALYLWCLTAWNNACVSNFVQNLKKQEIKFMLWPWLPFKGRPRAILKFWVVCHFKDGHCRKRRVFSTFFIYQKWWSDS